jgi:hypothetical protein
MVIRRALHGIAQTRSRAKQLLRTETMTRATSETTAPSARLSATIATFSCADHVRGDVAGYRMLRSILPR